MKIHFHDWGLWSDAHTVDLGMTLCQYRACKVCGKITFRSICEWISGPVDVALANSARAQALGGNK